MLMNAHVYMKRDYNLIKVSDLYQQQYHFIFD